METFLWFLFGLGMGLLIPFLLKKVNEQNKDLRWFEWILGILSLISIYFGVETFVHSLQEMQPQAAWLGLLFFGLFSVVLFVIMMRSIRSESA